MKSPRWLAVLVLALSSATFALPDNPSMQDGKKDVPGMSSGSPHSAQPPQPSPDALSLPADWRFAHPRADGLIAIRAAALAQSPLLRELLARFPRSFQMNAQKATSTLAQLGALDEAWISIRSGDFLALLQGRLNFPPGFVQLGNGMTSYRISRSAVVVGRAESVADAVERLSRASGVPSPAVRRMKELGAENEICLIGTRALLATPAMTPAMTPAAKDVTGFSLALALRDELRLDLRLDCATLESARRVLANMQKNPALPDSTVKVDAQLEGATVRLRIAVGEAELAKAMDKALSTPFGQQLTTMVGPATRPTGNIVIQGLPGGPQEIQPSGQLAPATAPTIPQGSIVIEGLPGGPKVIPPSQ